MREQKPTLVIGSPVCTPFSRLQALSWGRSRKTDAKLQNDLEEATRHMEFVAELYKMQDDAGRYYLHENPAQATFWQLACIQRVMGLASTKLVEADQCQYGLMNRDPVKGWGPALKPTKFMTNSLMLARELGLRCDRNHEHVHLMSGRAGPAAKYPQQLCEAICRGLAKQKRMDAKGLDPVGELQINAIGEYDPKMKEQFHEEDGVGLDAGVYDGASGENELTKWRAENAEYLEAYDDVSGAELDPEEVLRARGVEIKFFRDRKVYDKILRSQVPKGAKVISVRWIDINKGDSVKKDYRSRLVARQMKYGVVKEEWFAGTPPLEAMRLIISVAASKKTRGGKRYGLMANDVRRAYFYAAARETTYIELPEEDRTQEDIEFD